jgi:LmbE family N-acetylglucosaminyl deacetylase
MLGARLKILDMDPYTFTFGRKTVEVFDGIFREFTPDIVYTCWMHDSHQDHNTVARATIAAARKNTCSLYMCDHALPSGITPYVFRPQVFIDITDTIDVKMKAVTAHDSQVKIFGNQWLEGIKAKAIHHGFQFHVEYAEAFEVVKEIKDI